MSRSPHDEKRQRTTLVTTAGVYVVLVEDEVVLGDATLGAQTFQLPALSTVLGLSFTFSKIDTSSNFVTLDGNGGETINGQTTFDLTSEGDTVSLVALSTGWRIVSYVTMGALMQSDAVQTLVLDRSAGDLAAAIGDAVARSNAIDVRNFREIDTFLDLTTPSGATQITIVLRSSGLAAPAIADPADWSIERIDNITLASGASATVQYSGQSAVPAALFTEQGPKLTLPVRGRWMSALVYVSAGSAVGTRGQVFFYRRI